jgi:hypothetical protein
VLDLFTEQEVVVVRTFEELQGFHDIGFEKVRSLETNDAMAQQK